MPCLGCGSKVNVIGLSVSGWVKMLVGLDKDQLIKRLEANTNERFAIIRKIKAVKK